MNEHQEIIFAKILDIIENTIGKSSATITEATELIDDLGFASLDFIILFVEIEEAFQITIETDNLSMDFFSDIGSVVNYIFEATER